MEAMPDPMPKKRRQAYLEALTRDEKIAALESLTSAKNKIEAIERSIEKLTVEKTQSLTDVVTAILLPTPIKIGGLRMLRGDVLRAGQNGRCSDVKGCLAVIDKAMKEMEGE